MEKNVLKSVKEVCETYKCDSVLVTGDGQIFLEKAIGHAKNHAVRSKVSLQKVDADGEVLVSDLLNPGNEIKTLKPKSSEVGQDALENNPEPALKDQTIGQLRVKVEGLAKQKGIEPITSSKKKPLIEFIEKALTMEDKAEAQDEGGDNQNAQTENLEDTKSGDASSSDSADNQEVDTQASSESTDK